MTALAFDLSQTVSRRGVVRGIATGAGALAAAALLGCGGNEGASGSAAPSSGTGGSGQGTPKNIKRAAGFDPKLGETPINDKQVVQGGTFRRGTTSTILQSDPELTVAFSEHQLVNDRLLYANGFTGDLVPDMLTSWELVDKQGLEIVLKIRPGIKTHDRAPVNGRVFTAKDVAFSIMRKAGKVDPTEAKKYLRAQQYVGMTKAEAVDDVTIRLTFGIPNGSFMNALADPRASMLPVEQDTIGYKDPMKFVGTGAFIQTAFEFGSRESFKANPNYYRSWDEGARPGIDTYEDLVIADRASTLAAYLTGQLGWFNAVRPEEEPQIRASAKDSLWYSNPGPTWDFFSANLTLPQFKDPRVMKAFQLAIDYKAIGDPLGPWTHAAVTNTAFPEAWKPDEVSKLPGYNQTTKQQDVAEAVKLMEAAGYKDGVGMSFEFEYGTTPSDTQIRLKSQFDKIWPKIDVKVQGTAGDAVAAQSKLAKGLYTARAGNHTSVPDVALDLRTYYHTESIEGGRNYARFSQPWADEALDKLLLAQTRQERTQIVRPFIERLHREGPPLVLLRHPKDAFVVRGNFGGWDMATGPWAYQQYEVSPRWVWQTVS